MMCAGFRASTGVKYGLETKEGVVLDVVFDTRKEVEKWAINALGTYLTRTGTMLGMLLRLIWRH
jgi:hypothetical protein